MPRDAHSGDTRVMSWRSRQKGHAMDMSDKTTTDEKTQAAKPEDKTGEKKPIIVDLASI